MILYPAVIVHGLRDAETVLALGLPVTLLSAPGAAAYAGCLWWRELVAAASRAHPGTETTDILDCAEASGLAMGAIRCGVNRLILYPSAPGRAAVVTIAESQGGYVLEAPPPALDMGKSRANRDLPAWLGSGGRDSGARLV